MQWVVIVLALGNVLLGQERRCLAADAQHVVLEIDAALVLAQHVEAQEKVNVDALEHRDRAREPRLADAYHG